MDNEKGVITNIVCRRMGKEGATEKSGTLAVVTFKASQGGKGQMGLQNLHLLGPNGEEIPARTRAGRVDIFPHGSISGLVVDAGSQTPISGAAIEASREGRSLGLYTVSGLVGKYILNGIPPGNVEVTASKPEYLDNVKLDVESASDSFFLPLFH